MEQSPEEPNSSSASQEIPSILWNPKIHYHLYKSVPIIVLNQTNTVHALLF